MSGWDDLDFMKKFKAVVDKSTGETIMVASDAPEYELDASGNIVGGLPADKASDGTGGSEAPSTGFNFGTAAGASGGPAKFSFGVPTPQAGASGAAPGFTFGGGASGAGAGGGGSGGFAFGGGGGSAPTNFSFGVGAGAPAFGADAGKRKASDDPAAGVPKRGKRRAMARTGDETGGVYVAGNGDCGQMGLGEDEALMECATPAPIPSLAAEGVVSVACGGMHSVVVTRGGRLWTWGCNDDCALGRPGDESRPGLVAGELTYARVKAVCAGDCHTAALLDDGRVFSWGTYRDSNGYIGYAPAKGGGSANVLKAEMPVLVPGLTGVRITAIASGSNHTLAICRGSPALYAWGCGEQGQLGRSVSKGMAVANLVPAVPALTIGGGGSGGGGGGTPSLRVLNANFVTHVDGLLKSDPHGDWSGAVQQFIAHRAAVLDGSAPAGAEASANPPGDGVGLEGVFAGSYHSFALTTDGAVYAFGLNNMGQLGVGDLLGKESMTMTPQRVPGLDGKGVTMLHGGEHHSVALTRGGDVYVFGRGDSNQLGLGDGKEQHKAPQLVERLKGFGVHKVCCGSNQTAAVTTAGELYTWGFGEMYQLCNGKMKDCVTPYLVESAPLGSRRVLDVGMGGQHTVVLATESEES